MKIRSSLKYLILYAFVILDCRARTDESLEAYHNSYSNNFDAIYKVPFPGILDPLNPGYQGNESEAQKLLKIDTNLTFKQLDLEYKQNLYERDKVTQDFWSKTAGLFPGVGGKLLSIGIGAIPIDLARNQAAEELSQYMIRAKAVSKDQIIEFGKIINSKDSSPEQKQDAQQKLMSKLGEFTGKTCLTPDECQINSVLVARGVYELSKYDSDKIDALENQGEINSEEFGKKFLAIEEFEKNIDLSMEIMNKSLNGIKESLAHNQDRIEEINRSINTRMGGIERRLVDQEYKSLSKGEKAEALRMKDSPFRPELEGQERQDEIDKLQNQQLAENIGKGLEIATRAFNDFAQFTSDPVAKRNWQKAATVMNLGVNVAKIFASGGLDIGSYFGAIEGIVSLFGNPPAPEDQKFKITMQRFDDLERKLDYIIDTQKAIYDLQVATYKQIELFRENVQKSFIKLDEKLDILGDQIRGVKTLVVDGLIRNVNQCPVYMNSICPNIVNLSCVPGRSDENILPFVPDREIAPKFDPEKDYPIIQGSYLTEKSFADSFKQNSPAIKECSKGLKDIFEKDYIRDSNIPNLLALETFDDSGTNNYEKVVLPFFKKTYDLFISLYGDQYSASALFLLAFPQNDPLDFPVQMTTYIKTSQKNNPFKIFLERNSEIYKFIEGKLLYKFTNYLVSMVPNLLRTRKNGKFISFKNLSGGPILDKYKKNISLVKSYLKHNIELIRIAEIQRSLISGYGLIHRMDNILYPFETNDPNSKAYLRELRDKAIYAIDSGWENGHPQGNNYLRINYLSSYLYNYLKRLPQSEGEYIDYFESYKKALDCYPTCKDKLKALLPPHWNLSEDRASLTFTDSRYLKFEIVLPSADQVKIKFTQNLWDRKYLEDSLNLASRELYKVNLLYCIHVDPKDPIDCANYKDVLAITN